MVIVPAPVKRVSQSRKHRGYATQRHVAQFLATHGFPYAESTGAGRAGADITGTPGIDIEVKARAGFNPLAAMKQLAARSYGLPLLRFAVLRLNGQGEATVADYCVVMRLADCVELMRDAGYGDPR